MGTEDKRLQFKDRGGPGPGAYAVKETNDRKTYSFRKGAIAQNMKKTGPGPGEYETKSSIGELPAYAKT